MPDIARQNMGTGLANQSSAVRAGWNFFGWSLMMVLCLSLACAHVKTNPSPSLISVPESDAQKRAVRNNAAALLHEVLSREKDVDKLLIIKSTRKDVKEFIKIVAEEAKVDSQKLEFLAQADPSLDLNALQLPPGEQAARSAMSKSKAKDLLLSTGTDFEFKLLFSQVEALNYVFHMAAVAADNCQSPVEAREFSAMRDTLGKRYEQAMTLLRNEPGSD